MAASFFREAGPYFVRCFSAKRFPGGVRRCLCHVQQQQRQNARDLVRMLATAPKQEATPTVASSVQPKQVSPGPVKEAQSASDQLYRERYIPVTRRSIVRFLMEEKDFLTDEEKKKFDDFALALDSAIVNKYHGILQELKVLFDPINPDKDTVKTRQWSRREKLDNEFWLLQRLEDIMDKASFYELEKSSLNRLLTEHNSPSGVRVSVNPDRYDVLRFWILGKEQPEHEESLGEKMLNRFLRKPPKLGDEYYKRVIVAIRLKKDSKLTLKAFKEVPVGSLEMLLPDGTIRMGYWDRRILTISVLMASAGVVAKIVTLLAHVQFDWSLLLTLVAGATGIQAWTAYKNRRSAYLLDVIRMLYFKNVANNRGLLALLVDRAEDETFKEALLTYAFLLTSRPDSVRQKPSSQQLPSQLGGLIDSSLESKVEKWIKAKTGVDLEFDSSESVKLLKSFGLLSETQQKLNVLPLESALRCLPITPQSLIARSTEADITEGYDRDEYLETEHEYKEEERRSRRYGWF